ncbi:hypothetical protein K492DRAFT_235544 [Lichtheimia hyalospora FSU 10163]|nr:hypothetical protein K492DRAFT_235544 [Lichtheimia hyalospora FSU 10163]
MSHSNESSASNAFNWQLMSNGQGASSQQSSEQQAFDIRYNQYQAYYYSHPYAYDYAVDQNAAYYYHQYYGYYPTGNQYDYHPVDNAYSYMENSSYQSSSTNVPSASPSLPPPPKAPSKASPTPSQHVSSSSQLKKDERVSVSEQSSAKITEKTLCNTGNDGNGSVPMTTNRKPVFKQSKFGSFMGKLLLVKGKGTNEKDDEGHDKKNVSKKNGLYRSATEKTTTSKHHRQQNIMATNYFQTRKEASVVDTEVVKKTKDNNTKEGKCVSDSTTATITTTATADVVIDDTTSSLPTKHTHQDNAEQQNDKEADLDSLFDDVSSLSSRQSDDSVLGPWMSSEQDDNNDDEDNQSWCIDCDALSEQENPMEPKLMCDGCRDRWVFKTVSLINRIAGAAAHQRRRRPGRPPKEKQSKDLGSQKKEKVHSNPIRSKASTPTSGVKRKGKMQQHHGQKLPPPTKSRASKAIQKKTNAKKKKDEFVTTGAFMTRNTAKQLADPEHGFHPNPHGFIRMQQVEVLNFNGHWYRGVLTMMNANRVKVEYIDWQDQEEWIIMSSRRLRTIKPDKIMTESVQEEEDRDPLLPQASSTTTENMTLAKAKDDDYVTATLDTDPHQISNDNEVYLTRRMAQELKDEHGFRVNTFGYRYNRAVAVTCKRGTMGKKNIEYLGYLREMRDNQIRVWYPTLKQSDWLVVGSRRLRLLTSEEEKLLEEEGKKMESLLQQPPPQPCQETIKYDAAIATNSSTVPASTKRRKGNRSSAKKEAPKASTRDASQQPKISKEKNVNIDTSKVSAPPLKPTKKIPSQNCTSQFTTTGAFATRRAMRQLQDEHGFVPNPYGYYNNQPIEVLNTRTAKSKFFWERGHLVGMKPGYVKVRYDGWSDIYDEWFMVGSRKIRPASTEKDEPSSSATAVGNEGVTATGGDLLCLEDNPELRHDKRHHRLLGPEDYLQLGYLVPIIDPPPPPPPPISNSVSTDSRITHIRSNDDNDDDDDAVIDNDDDEDYTCKKRIGRRRRKRQSSAASNRNKRQRQTKAQSRKRVREKDDEDGEWEEQVFPSKIPVSTLLRRGRPVDDDDNNGFIANVYGYDYMQHVQVLHLDKKWYEARLVRMERNMVRVHFCGWIDKFDEYIRVGSRRIQVIENDHEVECIEPFFKERYESAAYRQCQHDQQMDQERAKAAAATATELAQRMAEMRRNRRRTLENMPTEKEGYAEIDVDGNKVFCRQCGVIIKQFRYYCTYCESPTEDGTVHSFDLCLLCFDQQFPFWHEHPRSSFAVQAVIDAEAGPMPIKGELVTVWEEDVIEDPCAIAADTNAEGGDMTTTKATTSKQADHVEEASQVFTGSSAIDTAEQGYKYLKRWQRRKVCAFCNDDDDTSEDLGKFIGPFVIATFNKNGVERKRQFWVHDACARYSPEVFCTPEGKWYNVTLALRRGRGMRCYACKEKGATIGCFESKCNKSFHLPCADKPVNYFRNGLIFFCPTHEAYYNKKDTYVNVFKCDGCQKQMQDESWYTCLPCASSYFRSYDLCAECFETLRDRNHPHDEDEFEETSFAILKEVEAEKAREEARAKELAAAKRKKPLFPKKRRLRAGESPDITCCYCGTTESEEWRKGYDGGIVMCRPCFEMALLVDNNDGGRPLISEPNTLINDPVVAADSYVTQIEDYTHKPYLTRDALSSTKFSNDGKVASVPRLSTYEPQPHQLFSLVFDSTYYDIPGRAPRWATHSGTDYHGTWLPQTVRRSILKHTEKDERVLSNFLGRGTDAIECFLLQRRCIGVDINPAAVALSQRNCCFEIPPGMTSAEYRPIIAQADSRHLEGSLFGDESFHHILSHPPYKDCVAYSTHLEGDLSRFTNIEEFKVEYVKVVEESWRLLKMGRQLTLGIGDNREHCFYIPVGFRLLRQYIDNGFELEELVIKRQRYCSAFGLGTYLCVQFDFLVFTHEFIATFRKIPLNNIDRMVPQEADPHQQTSQDQIKLSYTRHGVPSSAILRKSVVMGTVWVFKPTEQYRFEQLCMSRMVERFGRDDTNWEQVHFDFHTNEAEQQLLLSRSSEDISAIKSKQKPDDNTLSDYEQQRLKRIEENTRMLVQLGLISELSEESTDVMHYETMMTKPSLPEAPLRLVISAHQPQLLAHQINAYRQTLMQLARDAVKKLAPQGMLIIGTQDIRSADGKLWPMGMLVLEDIERTVDATMLKLKEMVVAVPDGYSKDRKQETTASSIQLEKEEDSVDIVDEHLPIVHAVYLVFQKL